jgi:hypothetical protein
MPLGTAVVKDDLNIAIDHVPMGTGIARSLLSGKDKASRHQPFHGGPVVKAALKYYCRAESDKSCGPVSVPYSRGMREMNSTMTPPFGSWT